MLTKKHRETEYIFRNPAQPPNKFDLSILRRKFDSIFPQIGFPVHTFVFNDGKKGGQLIRYPVSAAGSFENQADNKLPEMWVIYLGIYNCTRQHDSNLGLKMLISILPPHLAPGFLNLNTEHRLVHTSTVRVKTLDLETMLLCKVIYINKIFVILEALNYFF